MLALGVVVDLFAITTDLAYGAFVSRVERGDFASLSEVAAEGESIDERHATVGLLQGSVFLVTAIVFLVWFRRAYRNLRALGAPWLRFKPGWAVGAWFVPFLNAIRPKEIANDIWRVSDPDAPRELDGPALGAPVGGIVDAWWAVLVVSGGLARLAFGRIEFDTLRDIQNYGRLAAIADLVAAVSGVVALALVLQVTQRQKLRWERVSSLPPPPSEATAD